MTNDSQTSSQELHKYRKLGRIWERASSGSTGVKVNAILLIIGSSSWLLTMTKTSRGGSVVGISRSRTATNRSGAFLRRSGAPWGFEESWKTWKKAFGLQASPSIPWGFAEERAAIQDLCSFVSVLQCSPLTEPGGLGGQGCDCGYMKTPLPDIISWIIKAESVINRMQLHKEHTGLQTI